MNITVLLMAAVSSLGLGVIRSLLVRYFPRLPTEFDSTTSPGDNYDFIVVGAGCGGSVVASRLSETSASVLLLEAGGSAPPEYATPSLTEIGRFRDDGYWLFQLKSESKAFFSYNNRTGKVRMGKMMGGSSSTNNMVYHRGNKEDFDGWARLGNTGWDYDSVLPYFKRSENMHAPGSPVEETYHGSSGPVDVTWKGIADDFMTQFFEAGRQLGYSNIDPSGSQQIGFSATFETLKNGVRSSASESFLRPVVGRPNLQIRTNALVTRVLFTENKRAVGVEYVIDGKRRRVFARKEVILSAGVAQTPQLLMLSGVGPREHLEEMGIPVVAAVEGVGRNLQYHPGIHLPFAIKEGAFTPYSEFMSPALLQQYIVNQTGPLAATVGGEGFVYVNLLGELPLTRPDVFMVYTSVSLASVPPEIVQDQSDLTLQSNDDIYGSLRDKPAMAILPQLSRPKSRGSVSLRSLNPAVTPLLHANMLDHPDDVKLFVKAIRKAQEIVRAPALRDVLEVSEPEKLLTECQSHGRDTDAYWECFTIYTAYAGYEFTSSAKMAPPSDPMGVVSPRLSVRGVTGLRVVDGSIMPHIVSLSPMATVYMIGEKGADIIKEDWGYFTEFNT